MPLDITQSEGCLLIHLRVSPRARKARVAGAHAGALKLSVTEVPEKGRANEGVIRLLAATLGIPRKQIELVSGHTSQDKRVAITGLDEQTLRTRLQA